MLKYITFSVSATMLFGCASTMTSNGTINDGHARFENAWNKHDARALSQVYAADAKLLPPGAKMLIGREAIESYWKGRFDAGVTHITTTPVVLAEQGDMATDVRSFVATFKDTPVAGKFMYMWKKNVNGVWEITADIWNYDAAR